MLLLADHWSLCLWASRSDTNILVYLKITTAAIVEIQQCKWQRGVYIPFSSAHHSKTLVRKYHDVISKNIQCAGLG